MTTTAPHRALRSALAILCIAGTACADDPFAELQGLYPGIRSVSMEDRLIAITGARMTPGLTAEQAAAEFLAQHGDVFGVPNVELRELWRMPTRDERFTVFAYEQQIRGTDVFGSIVRVKVENSALPQVSYAVARLAREPVVGAEQPIVPPEIARAIVLAQPGYGELVVHGEPERVVLIGSGERPDAWVWRVRASNPEVRPSMRSFYVDTALPQVVYVQNEFFNGGPDPTSGKVEGVGTLMADHPKCPWCPYQADEDHLEKHPIPDLLVEGAVTPPGPGQSETHTDSAGEYVMLLGTTGSAIALDTWFASSASEGQWYYMNDNFVMVATEVATVGDTGVDLLLEHGSAPVDEQVAHVDMYLATHRADEFMREYVSASGLGVLLELAPNFDFCGATVGASGGVYIIQTGAANENCWNAATHSIVGHEFGHLVLFAVAPGLGMDMAFHEGYADAFTHMLNDNSIMGPEHNKDGSHWFEDPVVVNCQYPISPGSGGPCGCDGAHQSGRVLSGPWVRIRQGLKAHYGDAIGLERSRHLFGAWTLCAAGQADSCNGAHPRTLEEVIALAVNSSEEAIICAAFAAHSITCQSCCP